ncbi:hypothetical protein FQA39_LY00470 [Lamprigera yunnana]|nr:hypothetical protein FQA39_LY00470 [Lamprigera yunnana]
MFDVFGETTTHTAVQNSVSEPDEETVMEHSEQKPSTSESDNKWWLQDMFKHRCEHEQDNIQKLNEVVNIENDVPAPLNVNKTEGEKFGVILIELFAIDKIVNMENSVDESEKHSNPNKTKREKFDSGLGDEFIEKGSSSGSTSDNAMMYIHSLSSIDEHHEEKRHKRISGSQRTATCGKLRRVTLPNQVFDSSASEEEHTQNNIEANEVVRNLGILEPYQSFLIHFELNTLEECLNKCRLYDNRKQEEQYYDYVRGPLKKPQPMQHQSFKTHYSFQKSPQTFSTPQKPHQPFYNAQRPQNSFNTQNTRPNFYSQFNNQPKPIIPQSQYKPTPMSGISTFTNNKIKPPQNFDQSSSNPRRNFISEELNNVEPEQLEVVQDELEEIYQGDHIQDDYDQKEDENFWEPASNFPTTI